jgi:hypothetical protein
MTGRWQMAQNSTSPLKKLNNINSIKTDKGQIKILLHPRGSNMNSSYSIIQKVVFDYMIYYLSINEQRSMIITASLYFIY